MQLANWMKWLRGNFPGGDTTRPIAVVADPAFGEEEQMCLFSIISWGCAATAWLARALTSVPGVLCLHHVRSYIERSLGHRLAASDANYFKKLRYLGVGYDLVGEIHGTPRHLVPGLQMELGDRFRAAVVVRDPAPRLLSQLRLFEDRGYSEAIWTGLDYLRHMDGSAAVAHHLTDRKRLCFAHAANLLNSILEEASLARVFRCEDLTTSPAVFQELVDHLSGGKIGVDDELAERIVCAPRINGHGLRGNPVVIGEDWQREVLQAIVSPQAMALYARLGYEMPEWWRPAPARSSRVPVPQE